MQPPIFYAPPESISGTSIRLAKEELHHAATVWRLTPGTSVMVVDGLGTAYRGELLTDEPGVTAQVRVHATVRNFGEPVVHLTLAVGLCSASKFDTVIQKGTELGVRRFVPILSERSRVRIEDPERAQTKVRRLEKVALAAMKQCRRSYRPDISTPCSLGDFLRQTERTAANLIFDPSGPTGLAKAIGSPIARRVSLLVGPESGFSPDEVTAAKTMGYTDVSLGDRWLRAETAGPVVCALVMHLLGELG